MCAVKGTYVFILCLNVSSFFCLLHFRVRPPQKTKMSPSRPLTSLRTYLKSMILTLRSTSRFPTQVSSFCTSSSLCLDKRVFSHFNNKTSFLLSCVAEAKSLSVSSNALPVKDGAPRRSLNLEDYKKRRGLI